MSKQQRLRALKDKADKIIQQNYPGEDKIMVFGEGNPDAKIVMIGEAPGDKETQQRRPFVGKAGENLNEFLEIMHLNRSDIYITNIVKFRPFKVNPKTGRLSNRPPKQSEVNTCKPILVEEMEIIQPQIVVTLGNTSLKVINDDKKTTIGMVHAQRLKKSMGDVEFTLYPLYHPASIIYNRSLKDTYINDIKELAKWIKTDFSL